MSGRLTTNNSVSTLEEQTEVIKSIVDKESKKKKSTKRKPLKQVSKRAKIPKKLAALGSSMAEHEVDADTDSGHWPTWDQAQMLANSQAEGFVNYGNAVPGFKLGVVDPPEWDSDSQLDNKERLVHDISADVESEDLIEADSEQEPKKEKVPEVKISGVFANVLKQNISHVKEADRVAPKLATEVAFGVDKYLNECVYSNDMDKLVKEHPQVENVAAMKVPRLDPEVYQVLDHKIRNMDQNLQAVQKGIVGAMSALSLVLQLAFERADKDTELDEACGKALWDRVQLLSFSLNTLSARRRDLIKPALAPIYAQVLTKGHDTTPDWLYGGNLVETTKKVEVSKKISDKIIKKKPQPQVQQKQQQKQQSRGRGGGRGQLRGFNPWYGMRYQAPQQQQQFVPYQQQMGFQMEGQRVPRQMFYPQQQQQQGQQQFQKKPNNQK